MSLINRIDGIKRIELSSNLHSDLVAYYNFEEATGTRVDATGRGNDLTDNNTVTRAAGIIRNAASFIIANSEYLSRASSADHNMGDIDFTIALWVLLNSVSVGNEILSKWDTGGNQRSYVIAFDVANSVLICNISSAGAAPAANLAASSFGLPPIDQWNFMVVWYNKTTDLLNIQINNGVIDSATKTGGAFASTAPFQIGAVNLGGVPSNFLGGRIDAVGLWKRELTATERAELYNNGAGRQYPL